MKFQCLSLFLPVLAIRSGIGIWAAGALSVFFLGQRVRHSFYAIILFCGGLLLGLASCSAYGKGHIAFDLLPQCLSSINPFQIEVNRLTDFFLLLTALIICSVAIFSPAYLERRQAKMHMGIYWHCTFVFVIALTLTFLSKNAIAFLIFWEMMSLAAMSLTASDFIKQRARYAALVYLAITAITTILLLASFLWYHHHFQSWDFSCWHAAGKIFWPALLLFSGLALKSGVWPFHIWMSYAQAEAPSPTSVFMSTVMKLAAVYILIRLLVVDNDDGLLLGYIALVLGTISILWGSLFALLEHDLKRLLSYSSTENMGLILIALGLCLIGHCLKLTDLAGLALAATLFQSFNHSLAKTGLFIGAGSVEAVSQTRDLAVLGGLVKKMPWTTASFLCNSLSAIAIPPFSGFASKWMIYQCLFTLALSKAQVIDRALSLTLIGILSFVGALSLACYTKAIGICFLGKPRSEIINRVNELSWGSVTVQLLFASLCLFVGIGAPYLIALLGRPICAEVLPDVNFESYPPMMARFILPGMITVLLVGILLFILGKRDGTGLRKYVTWDCGYGNLTARAEETGTSFSESIARIFTPILRYRTVIEIKGKDRRHFPEVIKFESVKSPLLEGMIYKPFLKVALLLSRAIAGLQTGSIHLYLLYVFMTLLVLVCLSVKF